RTLARAARPRSPRTPAHGDRVGRGDRHAAPRRRRRGSRRSGGACTEPRTYRECLIPSGCGTALAAQPAWALDMKAVDFYKLPRAIQDRFVGSVMSGFPPAPLLAAKGAKPTKLAWLALTG